MNTLELRQHLASGGRAVFDLSTRAKFRLSGEDRVRYLNGQVSNDVRKLKAESALPACVMTAKGKMNALIWIGIETDSLRIDADAELRETLAGRLERYIISDDATLDDVTDDYSLIHVIGGSVLELGNGVKSRRFGMDGTDYFLPIGEQITGDDILQVDAETAETFRIEQGIPCWGTELDENTIPVEAGLEASSIDYHKGCYIGQEVISRIKSVGHVNRHLRGFVATSPLVAGTSLLYGDKEAGVITSTAWSFALDKAVALGYLKRSVESTMLAENQSIDLTADAVPVKIRTFPIIA